MTKDIELIRSFYFNFPGKLNKIRSIIKKPLSYAEKILLVHLDRTPEKIPQRGNDYVELLPDRVAMQDATAQMALLQFMHAERKKTAVPTTIHCDHLIEAECGSEKDLKRAIEENKEVYDFLFSVARKYGIDFWKPGAGIIHQIILENYAFPGGLIIGTDSHTPNAGGLGMIGVGVGGADAVDVMSGMRWELKWPKIIGVRLTGKLQGWTSPKDIILRLLGILSVKGGTGSVIEYFGEGVNSISATGRATICNMGAELGATSSVFPYDEKTYEYLTATERRDVADLAKEIGKELKADNEVYNNPESFFDRVIEIDLKTLEPQINGPFSPDLNHSISEMKSIIKEKDFPDEISACLIGSCTNSSYEDIYRAASVARVALEKGIKPKAKIYISPGSERVKKTVESEGLLDIFKKLGAVILANACGPCIGMWKRNDMPMGKKNTIITSFNRNFSKRADGNPNTHAFIASPEMVIALSLGGRLSFNPEIDNLLTSNGKSTRLSYPEDRELPETFLEAREVEPVTKEEESVEVVISPDSERLQLLERFSAWDGNDIVKVPVLMKVKGKCTTDHISMAGEWLKYRGHLDNISNNLLLGATNAFINGAGKVKNIFTGELKTPAQVAREYKGKGTGWVIIGDENYGEGSSREHAAMEVRYLGGRAVIAKSFARIHETNLKKQGVLVFTFSNPLDYEKIKENDLVSIIGLNNFSSGKSVEMILHHRDGTEEKIFLNHTYNELQIKWFKAGSALNLLAEENKRS